MLLIGRNAAHAPYEHVPGPRGLHPLRCGEVTKGPGHETKIPSEQKLIMAEGRGVNNEGVLPNRELPEDFEDDSEDMEDDDFEDLSLSALNEVEDMVRKISERGQSLNEKLDDISEKVRIECARSESLAQGVERLGHEVDELRKVVKNDSNFKMMRDEVDKLCREWEVISKSFKCDDTFLDDLGKIAVCVEQAICSYVLPEVFMDVSDASLYDLLRVLNSDDKPFTSDPNEQTLYAAKKRWETVCESFNFPEEWKMKSGEWSVMDYTVPGDIRAIEVLKLSRVTWTPYKKLKKPISLKYAEQNIESIKDELPPWQFKLVAAFIGSLREKMTRIGLHHDRLLLD